jgi:hypothetical protein
LLRQRRSVRRANTKRGSVSAKIDGIPAADKPKCRAGSQEFWTETRGAL